MSKGYLFFPKENVTNPQSFSQIIFPTGKIERNIDLSMIGRREEELSCHTPTNGFFNNGKTADITNDLLIKKMQEQKKRTMEDRRAILRSKNESDSLDAFFRPFTNVNNSENCTNDFDQKNLYQKKQSLGQDKISVPLGELGDYRMLQSANFILNPENSWKFKKIYPTRSYVGTP